MSTKNNEHLIPVVILDTIAGMNDPKRRETERDQLRLRVKAVRDYCDWALAKYDVSTSVKRKRS